MAEMTGTASYIQFGPCQVTFNEIDLGYFDGGVTFRYEIDYYEIEVDQLSMLVEPRIIAERAIAVVPMAEADLAQLQYVFPGGTYYSTGAKKIGVGGQQLASTDLLQLIIVPVTDNAKTLTTNSNHKVTIPKALAKPTMEWTWDRTGKRVTNVEFHAYYDDSQTTGENLFYLGDSSAT